MMGVVRYLRVGKTTTSRTLLVWLAYLCRSWLLHPVPLSRMSPNLAQRRVDVEGERLPRFGWAKDIRRLTKTIFSCPLIKLSGYADWPLRLTIAFIHHNHWPKLSVGNNSARMTREFATLAWRELGATHRRIGEFVFVCCWVIYPIIGQVSSKFYLTSCNFLELLDQIWGQVKYDWWKSGHFFVFKSIWKEEFIACISWGWKFDFFCFDIIYYGNLIIFMIIDYFHFVLLCLCT